MGQIAGLHVIVRYLCRTKGEIVYVVDLSANLKIGQEGIWPRGRRKKMIAQKAKVVKRN